MKMSCIIADCRFSVMDLVAQIGQYSCRRIKQKSHSMRNMLCIGAGFNWKYVFWIEFPDFYCINLYQIIAAISMIKVSSLINYLLTSQKEIQFWTLAFFDFRTTTTFPKTQIDFTYLQSTPVIHPSWIHRQVLLPDRHVKPMNFEFQKRSPLAKEPCYFSLRIWPKVTQLADQRGKLHSHQITPVLLLVLAWILRYGYDTVLRTVYIWMDRA